MQRKSLLLLSTLTFCTTLFSATLSQEIKNNSLVVYNSNLGLVHEERDLSIKKSDKEIIYEGVASSINTDSVNIQLSDAISLYSQQYRYDKITLHKLLEAHIGKPVTVNISKEEKKLKQIKATLLSNSGNSVLIQTEENKIVSVKSEDIIFETIPQELMTKPSLIWNVKATKNLHTKVALEYLINNISFKSDYLLTIDEQSASLTGWININNRSGKSFHDTKLTLLAGEINREQEYFNKKVQRSIAFSTQSYKVAQKDYQGYHLYTIPFRVTLANNEKTQIKFFSQKNISTYTEYKAILNNPLYLNSEIKSNVSQYIKLSPLDNPLPKGIIRTYSKLQDQTILLGESKIEHTPKNTPLALKIGTNFDLKVTQTPIERDDSSSWFNVSVKYSVTNSSNREKLVKLLIPFNNKKSSKIITDEKYRFTKGNFVTFSIRVKANSTKSFTVNYESKK